MQIAFLLFEDFETLDVFGPVEIFGRLNDLYTIRFYSLSGGIIKNNHGVAILTEKILFLFSYFSYIRPSDRILKDTLKMKTIHGFSKYNS